MIAPDTLADLRLADRSLRRYATLMSRGPIDRILRDAYVLAVRWNEPISSANRASVPLFRRVHDACAGTAQMNADGEGDDLKSVLQTLPVVQRGALLLITMESMPATEAAQILGVSESSVLDQANTAADIIRRRVPTLASASTLDIGRALGDLPVSQASPSFWAGLDTDLAANVTTSFPSETPTIAEPVLTSTFPTPPRESIWPAVLAGVGALAVIALIVIFLVSRSSGDDVAAQAANSTASTALLPPDDGQDTVQPTNAAPTSAAPTSARPTTPAPTTAPSSTPPPASSNPAEPGEDTDRGVVTFEGNLAIVEGSVAAGSADIWRVDVQAGHTLSVAVGGLNGIAFTVHRADGSAIQPDFADTGLQVFGEEGSHVLRFADGTGGGATYAVGIGLTPPAFGFLTNLDEQGVAFSTLQLTSCASGGGQLDATLITGEVVVTVTLREGTVTWVGAEEAIGEITAIDPVPTGLVLTGSVTAGRTSLQGYPFWLGIYGCDEVS